ncbi:MAG: hypothetical protein LUH23_06340 [Oscillospiraceae bacterium]|nr:hypothetical protein [Oscillospiraceae bacterium]
MKKILAIVMAVAMVMALSVTAFAATYDVELSLDNLGYYGATESTNVTVVDGGLNSSEEALSVLLPVEVAYGETVTVTIKGSSDGAFRVWLLNGANTDSAIWNSVDAENFSGGDFEFTISLEMNDNDGHGDTVANALMFKGISYGTNLDNFTITSVTLVTDGDEVAAETTDDADATEETSDESSEEVADTSSTETSSTETTTSTNADTGVVLALLPMAVAAAAVVVSKRK